MLEVITLPVLNDNYIYLIHDPDSNESAVVDPALAEPVLNELRQSNRHLSYIFNTHHHWDHVGGNLELKAKTGCRIFAGEHDKHRIPGIDTTLIEGDIIHLGKHPARIIFTPGHTLGHIVYHFFDDGLLFCGDTLFVMGCGRLFEGTPEQMWQSLQKLKQLPPDTKIYCTHEYTQDNARFAMSIEPENRVLQKRIANINDLRRHNKPTVPSIIADELATNPFFREGSAAIQIKLNKLGRKPLEIFSEIRKLKDGFK